MELNPKKFFIFQITLHSERYQPSSSPQNLSWNHNFCRNLRMPSFFIQPQQTYRKLQSQGDRECSNNMKSQTFGQEAMHLRFCQSSGRGSFSSRRLNRDVLPGGWRRNHVWLFTTPCTLAHQALLSMEFFRQEYWNGEPFASPGDLPDPGMESKSPAWQTDSLPSEPPEIYFIYKIPPLNKVVAYFTHFFTLKKLDFKG